MSARPVLGGYRNGWYGLIREGDWRQGCKRGRMFMTGAPYNVHMVPGVCITTFLLF